MDETNIFSVCINEVSNHLSKTIYLIPNAYHRRILRDS